MKSVSTFAWLSIATIAAVAHSGCGKLKKQDNSVESSGPPVVLTASVTNLPNVEAAKRSTAEHTEQAPNVTAAALRVSAEVTFKKAELFDRTFLYGFDLQYSSAGNAEYSLLDQSLALGHIPATFRKLGNKLQLVADNRRLFESVVNHPETLINEYVIASESETELTVTMSRPGLLVHKTLNGEDKPAPADQWLRSLEFDANGSYLLQETAVMLATGEVQTVLESLFPRESLVPEGYVGIEENRDTNPMAQRFMMIANEKVYVERSVSQHGVPVREQTAFANRYHLKDETSTIDWYVTSNAPDALMAELRSGVIGWNRYFKEQLGRDVVQFKGRLPASVKLGDPRYNVINFDSVAEAGAAYESQASDPTTGIQSHSLIYMPYAWYNIAAGLSTARELPNTRTVAQVGPKAAHVLFGAKRDVVRCVREASEVESIASSEDVVDDFGRRVFISTLFHELGHAFGLGHNFKASLAFDGTQPESATTNPTTYSVMDYNYYQHEIDLFREIGGTEGPVLEYDRQIISYLYNNGQDIKPTDRVIPACNDDDADSKAGGVDANCLRYDAESNPIVGLVHARNRLTEATGAQGLETKTLAELINVQRTLLIAKLRDAGVASDRAAAEDIVATKASGLGKLVGYHIASGAQSLRVNLSLNAVALRTWRAPPVDDGVVMPEAERRQAYVDILNETLVMTSLPKAPADALQGFISEVQDVARQGERFGSQEERDALAAKLAETLRSAVAKATKSALARTRGALADKLAFDAELSFASGLLGGKTAEEIAVASIAVIATSDLTKGDLGGSEAVTGRTKAVKALKTFAALGSDYKDVVDEVRAKLEAIKAEARGSNQGVVDHVRALLALL